jgi:hypothetical protein
MNEQRLYFPPKLRVGAFLRQKPGSFELRQPYAGVKQALDFLP